jgi:glutathione S-transferase
MRSPGDPPVTLITFPLSNFCEKARWALDHAGVTFREHGYPPAIHKLAVLPHRGSSVPLLVATPTQRQSTDILALADRACRAGDELYPTAPDARHETDELIARWDADLGPQARVWFYGWALAEPRRLRAWASCGLPRRQRALLNPLAGRIAAVIASRLGVDEHSAAQARDRIDEELGHVSAKLADGRRYLAGDRFGAADLTFAALTGPILLPPGYGGGRFMTPPMPKQLEPQIAAWRATTAGQHALRMYRDHRFG